MVRWGNETSGSCSIPVQARPIVTELASSIGYNAADAYAHVTVSSALGQEDGFGVRVNELTACGVTTFNFALNVFPLRAGVDGLLGMNFLRHFNFEIRLTEMCILLELISPELEILG